MASKKPARIIAPKNEPKRSVAKSKKMKKELSGSFGQQARREGSKSGKKARAVAPAKAVKGYAGELVLKATLSAQEKTEIMNLIRHTAATGPRDPDDQVVDIKETKDGLRIRTSENHLALAIGKKIARAHKGGKLDIVWSDGDLVARAVWTRA